MSAFTKVGKASASAVTSAIKSIGKELSTNALVQTLSGKKGRINYRSLSRSPSQYITSSISPSVSPSLSQSSYLKPITPIYSRSSSIINKNNNEYNNTQDTIFKPEVSYGRPMKLNEDALYGGKNKRNKSRRNLESKRISKLKKYKNRYTKRK
jgi:hypothetical protein